MSHNEGGKIKYGEEGMTKQYVRLGCPIEKYVRCDGKIMPWAAMYAKCTFGSPDILTSPPNI